MFATNRQKWIVCVALALWNGIAAVTPAAAGPAVAAVPPAPDYSRPDAWAAWPGRPGSVDEIPPGLSAGERHSSRSVDVFFIHPTTYLTGTAANARYDEPGQTEVLIERSVLRFQASAFNDCCRIFAPHYRQAALAAFFHRDAANDSTALSLAYGDVLKAFDYYIAHENHDRPFIVASHSQGSLHALRLLQERVAGTPLQQRLVAAYVVGYFVPRDITQTGLPLCEAATQTGCIISWNTVKPAAAESESRATHLVWLDGRYQRLGNQRIVCTNPLTWTIGTHAPANLNLGALPGVPPSKGLLSVVPALTGADCVNDVLTVDIPLRLRHGFADLLTVFGSYHIYDYSLFYANIRANAVQRAEAFMTGGTSAPGVGAR
jgi:hypothetical protein